jgi:hypothetical protein
MEPSNASGDAASLRVPASVWMSSLWLRLGIAAAGVAVLGVSMLVEGERVAMAIVLAVGGAVAAWAAVRHARTLLDGAERATAEPTTLSLRPAPRT